uniref:Secreted protein n=1 Tax=Syphacia muris TaxID=451379 RepID=A0A0N5AG63_9BILA
MKLMTTKGSTIATEVSVELERFRIMALLLFHVIYGCRSAINERNGERRRGGLECGMSEAWLIAHLPVEDPFPTRLQQGCCFILCQYLTTPFMT